MNTMGKAPVCCLATSLLVIVVLIDHQALRPYILKCAEGL